MAILNSKIKASWLKALRSKKYEQCVGSLREDKTHFCCLGVLCDLYDPLAWKILFDFESDGEYHFGLHWIVPPRHVIDWAFDDEGNNLFVFNAIANMNDRGSSFEEIADYIENHYDK